MQLIPLARVVALLVAAAATSHSQPQEPAKKDPPRPAESRSEGLANSIENAGEAAKQALGIGTSITGCLKQGDESDPYILSGGDAGKSVTVVGPGSLVEHVNHTVKLTGDWESAGTVFHITGIEHVSSSCDEPSSAGRGGGGGWPPKIEGITADQQGQSPADRKTTQEIRRAVVADDSLSTYAHNVKIITRDGVVTLRGAVRSEQERSTIESMARAVAGMDRVHNELSIEPRHPDSSQEGRRQP